MSFQEFASVCAEVEGESAKREKVKAISAYLGRLGSDDLETATRLFLGTLLPKGKRLYVSYSAVIRAVALIARVEPHELEELVRRYGDVGEAVERLLETRTSTIPLLSGSTLSFSLLRGAWEAMASDSGPGSGGRRVRILAGLLSLCSPREARYLVRSLGGEMRIGVSEGMLEEAIALALGLELETVRRAHTAMADLAKLAALAKAGALPLEVQPMQPFKVMLAEPAGSASEISSARPLWMVEDKYDGIRAQLHKLGRRVAIFSRSAEDMSDRFPHLVEQASVLPDVVLDGELVSEEGGRLRFFNLQRISRSSSHGLRYAVFDVLYLEQRPLRALPLVQRKEVLRNLSLAFPPAFFAVPYGTASGEDEIQEYFQQALARGNEGIVAKDPQSSYELGARGKSWMKLKQVFDTIDAVVIGAEWGHGKRRGLLSNYVFAIWCGERLCPIGKAYSGLTDAELEEYTKLLLENSTGESHGMVLVKPFMVVEVGFQSIQRSRAYESDFALRFPRIMRVRQDKGADEADDLEKVRMIYESQQGR
ncbi:MAG: ATP-dependent DNA ligase [TACK group archaeon]|nr:ATP-dependent DNA ligase [TACK group archaeon]